MSSVDKMHVPDVARVTPDSLLQQHRGLQDMRQNDPRQWLQHVLERAVLSFDYRQFDVALEWINDGDAVRQQHGLQTIYGGLDALRHKIGQVAQNSQDQHPIPEGEQS